METSQVSRRFKYRDRIAIIIDILEAVKYSKEGMKKTRVMQDANLNYKQVKRYLNYLTNRGLLSVDGENEYLITSKGSKFLRFTEMQEILNLR